MNVNFLITAPTAELEFFLPQIQKHVELKDVTHDVSPVLSANRAPIAMNSTTSFMHKTLSIWIVKFGQIFLLIEE